MNRAEKLSSLHTFAVCAYGQSPYLTECLDSLLSQRGRKSELFIATSTPSAWLDGIASEYGIQVYVNHGDSGIGQDWNFAYSIAKTPYVTIAHQDDVYCPDYAEEAVSRLASCDDSLIYFTDYGEIRQGKRIEENRLLSVKRLLLKPLTNQKNASKTWAKRASLRFGSAICCPSVTLNVRNCPNPPFLVGMKSNLDWATWERLSRLKGSFLYNSKQVLMYHRIHADSATTELIASRERDEEDLCMLELFWPKPIAAVIERLYSKGTESNDL